jgi:hypothetical protein
MWQFWINQLDEYIEKCLEQYENMQHIMNGNENVDMGLNVCSAEFPCSQM